MIKRILGLCLTLNLVSIFFAHGQNLYDINTLQKIEIWFSQPNWDYAMDTAKHGSEEYLMADWVKVNGVMYDSVGVKYKGNSSYDSTRFKNPLHIAFDEYKDQKHQNYTDIKLSNAYSDPTFLREVLGYSILANYMHCPMANFAQVYINGVYYGLYSSAENIDKKFCGDHFYTNYGTFIKCNPTISPSPTIKSNLKFINADSNSYSQFYEIKSKSGWNELVKLCDSLGNYSGSLSSFMDVDRAIWMLAFNNTMVNLDSYSGVFAQNYYVYKDKTNHYNPIVWDLNMCFGGFPFAGAGTSSMGTLNLTGLQQFSTLNHETDSNWPLINAIHANPTYKRMYFAHMRTMLNEQITSGAYKTLTNQLHSIIDTAVQSDVNGFFTYTQFSNSTNTDYPFGSYTVPGLYNLMDNRASYLLTTTELMATPPSISNVNTSSLNPNFGTTFNILATVSNANTNAVWLGFRSDKTVKFERTLMFDDGAHNDGAAGDNIYGASLVMNAGLIQYYIYAENSNAGIFSPERAEHEFHTVFANAVEPSSGDLVINEILADNVQNVKDEYNDTEDWIELYNKTGQVLNLSNTYLATQMSNLSKWKFPNQTFILPNGFITIWADDDSTQEVLHTNFGLNKQADTLYLSRNGLILDSVTFSNQQSDTSYGRYPNGTGPFIQMNTTFNAENNNFPLSIHSLDLVNRLQVTPIPANDYFVITCEGNHPIQILNSLGQQVLKYNLMNSLQIDCSKWPSGIYYIKIQDNYKTINIVH
jgi:spore coat protein CotH